MHTYFLAQTTQKSAFRRGPGLLSLIALLLALSSGCQEAPKPQEGRAFHAEIKIGAPIAEVVKVCPERRCVITDAPFEEVEYTANAAGLIKAVTLRFPAVKPPSVQASQEYFGKVRAQVEAVLGPGQTFLASGDPTYWPMRKRNERVVTLTMDHSDRTVLSIGPAGPDAEKIADTGAANNPEAVQRYWTKLANSLK